MQGSFQMLDSEGCLKGKFACISKNRRFFSQNVREIRPSLQDLGLEHLTVIHPGSSQFPLTEKITACGLEAFVEQETIF